MCSKENMVFQGCPVEDGGSESSKNLAVHPISHFFTPSAELHLRKENIYTQIKNNPILEHQKGNREIVRKEDKKEYKKARTEYEGKPALMCAFGNAIGGCKQWEGR